MKNREAAICTLGDWVAFRATRESARDAAAAFLREAGFDVSAYRRIERVQDRTDATAAAYLLEKGGAPAVTRVYGTLAPTPLWRVRFFVPGQKEEHWVSVDANSGKAVGFRRTLLDDAPGARLPKEQALELARAFLLARGVDLAHAELKEQTQKDEKARRDHTLTWELAVPAAGEAKVRHEVVVQGDKVGSWTREVKIPEAWRRAREKETALTVIVRWLKLPLIGVFAALGILLLVAKVRAGELPWKAAALLGAVAAAAVLLRLLLSLDTLWSAYDTAIPAGTFAIVIGVSLAVGALGSAVAAATASGLAAAIYPEALTMWRAPARRVLARDALVAGFVALGMTLGLPALRELIVGLVPSGRLFSGVSWPNGVEASVPWLATTARAVSTTLFAAALAAIAAAVVGRHFRTLGRRLLLALLVALSFLPSLARTPAEYAAGLLALAVVVAGVLVLAIFFLRRNPLAWVTAAWLGLGGAGAIRLLAEPGGVYRLDGALALTAVLLPVAWLALAARRQPATQPGSQS